MHVIRWVRQRIEAMLNPRVVDEDGRRRHEARERVIRARLESLRIETEVATARHIRDWTRE